MKLKRCPDCGFNKAQEEFGSNRTHRDGLASYCRVCFRARSNAAYRRKRARQGTPVRERVAVPEGHKHCSACRQIKPLEGFSLAPYQRDGRNSHCKTCISSRQRDARFLRVYGLTPEALTALIEAQDGLCAICIERPAKHVDHDHVTGEIRGVVCFRCNVGIGHFSDRSDLLQRASAYLERTTWQRTQVCKGVYRLTSPRPAAHPSPSSSAMQHLISSRRTASSPAE